MSETLMEYPTRLRGEDGRIYVPRACGRERADGMWEGWLEFTPVAGGAPLVSERETTQPNRADIVYWASGLTDPYLDGALLRVQRRASRADTDAEPVPPAASRPAAHKSFEGGPAGSTPIAVLDPFHVYAEGDDILRRQLRALSGAQLRNIIRAYALSDLDAEQLATLTDGELAALIVAAVEPTTR